MSLPAAATQPITPLYLLYGTRHEAVLKTRDQIVALLIEPEFRNENVTNYDAAGHQKLTLAGALDQIAGDLATMSFFPGTAKIAIVTNPQEIFSGDQDQGSPRPRRGGSD